MATPNPPEHERPRERLLSHGPAALSDAELLAIMLRTGVAGASAIELARESLAGYGSVALLLGAPVERLAAQRGWGLSKAVCVKAAVELARRVARDDLRRRDVLTSPEAVRDYLRGRDPERDRRPLSA
jgi:DNA repair protein RadC